MTCSDGTVLVIDAQPNFAGFDSIPLRAGGAVDSLLGVGAQTGGEAVFTCPP